MYKRQVSLLTQRREKGPAGLRQGGSGLPGQNILLRANTKKILSSNEMIEALPGDIITLETPGGGGWGIR